ncbi:uncharacterized protein LOC128680970 isoform X2 [Plodia interpunctella]|uniref:uncharacterized protein LOC128680970 isoform X2 n=1 Tax=Plodia interpunctella TaxID=58824 RepID=UPI002367B68A|nr:uncharacterized protein LOC128680970 isoform X2 [Plodia interpunctella]
MSDEEEIEYLDEDAEIVQQCVQKSTENQFLETKPITPLLVERPAKKKKRKIEEDDSDYDPRDDIVPPPSNRNKKKKLNPARNVTKVGPSVRTYPVVQQLIRAKKPVLAYAVPKIRRNMKIFIPDYPDPLCLPVRAIMRTDTDRRKLKSWNNACISHLKHADKMLKPEKGVTKGSSRTVVLRNFQNRQTGKYETAVWAKTSVINDSGITKSQNFQSILPNFSERTVLKVNAINRKPKKFHRVDEVILTKENYDNEESLVVYKPKQCILAVYQMITQDDSREIAAQWRRRARARACARPRAAPRAARATSSRGGRWRRRTTHAITFAAQYVRERSSVYTTCSRTFVRIRPRT